MPEPRLTVRGLREAISGLGRFEATLESNIDKANRKYTRSLVLPEVRENWRSQRIRPSVANRVAVSDPSAALAAIRLRYGGTFPYAAGVAFGAKQYPQFRPWVGNRGPDYIIAPAVERTEGEFARRLLADIGIELDRLLP